MNTRIATILLSLATLPLWLGGCQQNKQAAKPPPEVGVLIVHARDLPLRHDLVGRLAPTRIAQVRARVTGIVMKRAYQEGSDVTQGQLLFQIDPAPLQAALDEPQAALQQALAWAQNDRSKAERTRTLAARGVISRQALDDANAEARSSQAAVAGARASVASAKLNLSYARVTAPIAGRASRALVTEGALVSQGSATQLTTIEQIDPLYIDFSQPLKVVEQWRKQQSAGELKLDQPQQMTVTLTMADGSRYAHTGHLDFTDMRVDPDTGSVSLRARIDNPERSLLPGMFVAIELNAGTLRHVMRVPQQAVLRDGNSAYVLVVDDQGMVVRSPVHTRGTLDGDWIIDRGLADGQRIVASGVQRARPGSKAKPVPWPPQPAKAASSTRAPD
ncbi:MAG: efflux RND transporter periplasmic adaptor subunit [Rhodanobacteraceae bacterium]